MKEYDKLIETGVKWIGSIPSSWSITKIKYSSYVKARIGWQGLRSSEFFEKEYAMVVTGTDFVDGKIDWTHCYQVSKERFEEDPYIQLRNGDLLITKDGTIGKVAVVKNIPKETTLNSGVFVIRPENDIYITSYLYWVLNSSVFSSFYNYNKSGSTIQHLYQNVFDQFSFPLPSLKEQEIIVAFLEGKTSEIDTLISKKQKLIELLGEERCALINEAVTKGLNPNAKMKDSGIEWLGEIPEHWAVKKLKYLSDKIGDGLHGTPTYVDSSEYFFINGNNIGDGIITLKENAKCVSETEYLANKKELNDNTILMSINGTIGSLALYNNEQVMLGKSVAYINLVNLVNKDFIFYCLQSHAVQGFINQQLSGSTIKNLSLYSINNIPLPYPTIEIQGEIVKYVNKEQTRLLNIVNTIKKEIELLYEYKTALISEVVTGKIDVRDYDTVSASNKAVAVSN